MKKLILIYVLQFFLFSCNNDFVEITNKDFPFIILNEILSISNEGVVISASLYNDNEVPFFEYGLVSASEHEPTISDSRIVFYNDPGKEFQVSINNDLIKGENYYVRAFIRTSNKLIYSNTLSFESQGCLPPDISSISDISATSGNRITIIGNNFSSVISHLEVCFDDLKSTIIKASIDTLVVFCPNTSTDKSVKIKVTVASQTTEASQDFKLLNPWKQIDSLPANPYNLNGHLTHNSKGYLISEAIISDSDEEQKKLWEFDMNSYEWDMISNIPFSTGIESIGFSKGNDLFCGLGSYQRDLWQFNLNSKTWFQKSSYPGLLHYLSYPVFQINNSVYLYSYQDGFHEFWKYLIESDTWVQLPTPTELNNREFICGYLYNNTGYLLEMDIGIYKFAFNIWKFNDATNSFTINHSVLVNSGIETGSFIINDNLYIPTKAGNLIQYSLTDGLLFYLDDPTDMYEFSFVFQNENKAVVGKAFTSDVYEFYPR